MNNFGMTPLDIDMPAEESSSDDSATFGTFQSWKKKLHPSRMTADRLSLVLEDARFAEVVKNQDNGVKAVQVLLEFMAQGNPQLSEESLKTFGQLHPEEYHILLHAYRIFYEQQTQQTNQ